MGANDEVLDFYNNGNEEKRLAGHSLERIRTQELILRHITNSRSVILDVRGVAGVYSFWLHDLGHDVHLIDFTPLHIEQAIRTAEETQKELKTIAVGDAKQLDFDENTFDVVLMLGPLYHFINRHTKMTLLHVQQMLCKS